jgi:hypothetical protein
MGGLMTKNRALYRYGVQVAYKEGAETRLLFEIDRSEERSIKQALIRRNFSPKLKAYIGKGAS